MTRYCARVEVMVTFETFVEYEDDDALAQGMTDVCREFEYKDFGRWTRCMVVGPHVMDHVRFESHEEVKVRVKDQGDVTEGVCRCQDNEWATDVE